MWARILRDVISPLAGLAIEAHEVLVVAQPREWAVVAGLLLLGVPVDQAASLLGAQLRARSSDSSPPASSPIDPPPSA